LNIRRQWRSFDFVLALAVCALSVFGIVMLRSAVSYSAAPVFAQIYSKQQFFFLTGFALLILTSVIDYHFIARFYVYIYALSIILLVIVLFLGPNETNTARWIELPGNINIQPSEFAKLFIIVSLSVIIEKYHDKIDKPWFLLAVAALIAVPSALIFMQPALSACFVIIVTGAGILFNAQIKARYVIAVLVAVGAAVFFLYYDLQKPEPFIKGILATHQFNRLISYINPDPFSDASYQTEMSLNHIGSGMMTGQGLGNGSYIPYGTNDFIFAVIGKELGFVGCIATIAAMFIVISKCLYIAYHACDTLGRLIASGVAVMMAFEVFVNIGVATAIVPNTGMPLPFLSSGGSSMWVHMACIGLVINVGLYKQKLLFEG